MTNEFEGLETNPNNNQEPDDEAVSLTVEMFVTMCQELQRQARGIPQITRYFMSITDGAVQGLPEGMWAYVYRDEWNCPVFVRLEGEDLMEVFTEYNYEQHLFFVKTIKIRRLNND